MVVFPNETGSAVALAEPVAHGPVLVACDATPASQESLVNAARRASQVLGGSVEVVGVCEPTPVVAAGMDVIPVPVELD